MKPLFQLTLLILACHSSAFASDLADLLGPPVKLIERLEGLSRQKDYAAIYRLLGSEYRGTIEEKYFVDASRKLSWSIIKLRYGRLDTHRHFAWMPVSGVVQASGPKEIRFDTVAFFAEEKGEWKLVTFPFIGAPHLPEMGAIPAWILAAEAEYGTK